MVLSRLTTLPPQRRLSATQEPLIVRPLGRLMPIGLLFPHIPSPLLVATCLGVAASPERIEGCSFVSIAAYTNRTPALVLSVRSGLAPPPGSSVLLLTTTLPVAAVSVPALAARQRSRDALACMSMPPLLRCRAANAAAFRL